MAAYATPHKEELRDRVVLTKRTKAFILIGCLILSLGPLRCTCQPVESTTSKSWGLEDGLPEQQILAIAQTPDGYLWLGTPHGLIRFDGTSFVMQGSAPFASLSEFGISCIVVDSGGGLWIGSVGGGITHYTRRSIEHYGLERGLTTLRIRDLAQTPDGVVWAGTDQGLFKLDKGQMSFEPVLQNTVVTALARDDSDGLWVGGQVLIHLVHGQPEAASTFPVPTVIRALVSVGDGRIWAGGSFGLIEIDSRSHRRVIANTHVNVRSMYRDASGCMWIGTIGSGLLRIGPDGQVSKDGVSSRPGAEVIRALYATKNGDLWLGSQTGLIRLSHTGMSLIATPNASASDPGSLMLDRDGSVWLGAGSISRYDGLSVQKLQIKLGSAPVRALFRDSTGSLWIGTFGDGAYEIDSRGTVHHFGDALGSNGVTGFLEDSRHSIWIGTDKGLARSTAGSVTSLAVAPGIAARTMTMGPDGSVWFGTSVGLFHFRGNSYVTEPFMTRLAGERIWSLYASADGSLWIGTGSGLFLWCKGELHRVLFAEGNSAPNGVVSVAADSKGRLLIAESTVIYRFQKDQVVSASSKSDSPFDVRLRSTPEVFAVAMETGAELYGDLPSEAQPDSYGGMWYASYQGLIYIDPTSRPRTEPPPPVYITTLRVDGTTKPQAGSIYLPPSVHSIELQASPVNLSSRAGLIVRHRLLGFDKDWSDSVPSATWTYGTLPPGSYTFQVEAHWPGETSEGTTSLTIIQASPFYKKPVFILLACLALGILIWILYRLRIHQMRIRFRAVSEERSRMAREIHDTLLQGCIGVASLLEAVDMSQSLTRSNENGQTQRWRTILRVAREQMMGTIKESRAAIWSLRNIDEKKPLLEMLEDLLKRLCSRSNIVAEFSSGGRAIPVNPVTQHELLMVAREAILNAINHSGASLLKVHAQFTTTRIRISIADNGDGFETDTLGQNDGIHFGLVSMDERMTSHGGTFVIDSRLAGGTTVVVELPIVGEGSHNDFLEVTL